MWRRGEWRRRMRENVYILYFEEVKEERHRHFIAWWQRGNQTHTMAGLEGVVMPEVMVVGK